MLTKFSVKNFRNFKDELVLDFKQEHDYKFNTQCVKDKTISKIVIFGNNGEGKSNLGFAVFDIVMTTTDLFVDTRAYDVNNFLNADSDIKYASFNYEFKFGEDIIKYNYKKNKPKVLKYEELYINNELIYNFDFETKKGNFDNLIKIGAETLNLDKENMNFSILKFISNNTVQKENSTISKLISFIKHMLWFRSLGANAFIGFETEVDTLNGWIVKNNLIKDFEKFLKDIANVDMKLTNTKIGNNIFLLDKHKERALIFNDVASSGTKALQLFFYWSKRFKEASLVFIDEFDAFYHFELSENIIRFLLNYNMQVILTSHNTNLADNKLMRPDCYFILKSGKIKSFVDSTERELREGHNLSKMLKEGEFDE